MLNMNALSALEADAGVRERTRLEWNYNSNHIEGNTLTYRETELLLIHGRTAGGHPMRDYDEMKVRDVAIDYMRSLAGEKQIIGEGDIRQLNKILLKEPFLKYAGRMANRRRSALFRASTRHSRVTHGR